MPPENPQEIPLHPDPQPETTPPATLDPTDGLAALALYTPAALALDATTLVRINADPPQVYANVARGTAAVLDLQAAGAVRLKDPPWTTIASAPTIAKALWYQHNLCERMVPTKSELFSTVRRRVADGRELILSALRLLANQGKIPRDKLDAIVAGTGLQDMCADVTAGRDLLVAANATALVGDQELSAAVADAERLAVRIRPHGQLGGYSKTGDEAAAIDLRNRLFTLLLTTYTEVRRVALAQWVDAADALVPRVGKRRL